MTVFHPDAVLERREEMVGKPLLTGSALSSDNLQDICDVEAVPPEADVLIKNTFSIIHIAKIPISKVLNRQRSGQYTAEVRRVESRPATDSNRHVDNSNRRGLAGSNCSTVKGQLEHLAYWAQ